MKTPHILILGGTGDARKLADQLAESGKYRITLSLAGRTSRPLAQSGEIRTGGFGGVAGLVAELQSRKIDLMVDATHPFASQMSRHAFAAAQETGVELIALERPQWEKQAQDRWLEVASMEHAAQAVQDSGAKRIFLAIGRQEVGQFSAAHDQHFIIRSIDPVAESDQIEGSTIILDRGPFDLASERALFQKHRIDCLVTKNSGGEATYAKLAIAREFGIATIMVQRPRPSGAQSVKSLEALMQWIAHYCETRAERGE